MFGNTYGYPYLNPQLSQQNPYMPGSFPVSTPSMQQQNTGPAFIPVPSAKDFDSVTIQPGRQALIMAQNDPFIAFKTADAMGKVTTKLYRLEPVSADQINGPSPEYVTRQEFQQTIQTLIDGINKPGAGNGRQNKKEGSE